VQHAVNARDARRVRFEDDGGDGAPVAILGGFLDPIELVRRAPIARALGTFREEFRLVFVDHRGHGLSDRPHDAASYAMILRVADVVAVLDALEIARAHVLGISWGGRLGFGMAQHAPERVRSLVAIGQHPYAIDPEGALAQVVREALALSKQRGIAPLVEAFEAIAGRYPEEVRSIYLGVDAEAMRAAWESALAEDAVARDLQTWTLRCLICVAEDDTDFFEPARRAASEIPNAEFVAIPGTDHLGVDTAGVDPLLPAVLRTLRGD
jgi:pimeloyl-ACP methyl ester carboxylesterase